MNQNTNWNQGWGFQGPTFGYPGNVPNANFGWGHPAWNQSFAYPTPFAYGAPFGYNTNFGPQGGQNPYATMPYTFGGYGMQQPNTPYSNFFTGGNFGGYGMQANNPYTNYFNAGNFGGFGNFR